MRSKLIAIAMVSGVFLAGSASAEGVRQVRVPLISIASVTLAKQPTLVQTAPMPRKPL
jgi:hypothetical protein